MILRGSVRSSVLSKDAGITVVGPKDVRRGKPYNVIYVLHGVGCSNESWVENTMLPIYARNYNTIFVLPDGARSFYTDMAYGSDYFAYLTQELPEICKSIFNISSKREQTGIMGASMGGYGALRAALKFPYKYGMCCAFASAILFLKERLDEFSGDLAAFREAHGDDIFNDFRLILGDAFTYDPDLEIMELARRVSTQSVKPAIYAACGYSDFLYGDNHRFGSEMERLGFDFTYEEWDGKHDWYFFDAAIRRALEYFSKEI